MAVTNTFSAQKLSEYAEMVVNNLRQIGIEDLKRLCSTAREVLLYQVSISTIIRFLAYLCDVCNGLT